jgi:hypothetical protein
MLACLELALLSFSNYKDADRQLSGVRSWLFLIESLCQMGR